MAGKEKVGKIYAGDVERFASWDTSFVWDQFPPSPHVLTIHGLADDTVPPWVETSWLAINEDSLISSGMTRLSMRGPFPHGSLEHTHYTWWKVQIIIS